MKRFILLLAFLLAPLAALADTYDYGATPTVAIPKTGYRNWGPPTEQAFKDLVDFNAIFANADGTLKTTTTATPWQQVTGPVTWLSATSFKVPSTTLFETGRRLWAVQATSALCYVEGTSTAGGETTVTAGGCEEYNNPGTPTTLTSPITSVSVSMVTLRSEPLPQGFREISQLVIANNASTPNSKVDISAASLGLESSAGFFKRFVNPSVTLDITTTGAGGRDLAAVTEAANAWYEVWGIGKSDGTFSGLLKRSSINGANTSASASKLVDSGAAFDTNAVAVGDYVINTSDNTYTTVTAVDSPTQLSLAADIFASSPKNYRIYLARAPTMPSGYTYKLLIGYVYNDGSSNFRKFYQYGPRVTYDAQVVDVSGLAPSTTWTTVLLSIPPKVRLPLCTVDITSGGAATSRLQWRTKGSSSTGHDAANGGPYYQVHGFLPVPSVAKMIEVRFDSAVATVLSINTNGYLMEF